MATAHKVMVTIRTKSGKIQTFPYTTTDTNAAFFLAPSGQDQIVLSGEDCWIIDEIHSTQGTCTQVYVYFNNVRIPDIILTAAEQPNVNRQIPSSPILVPAGTMVKFQTIT